MLTRTTRYAVLIYKSLCDSITYLFRLLFKRDPGPIHLITYVTNVDRSSKCITFDSAPSTEKEKLS